MTILTIPVVTKGQTNIITLNKTTLAADVKVVADSYFAVQSNWKQVVVTYKTDIGSQKHQLVFDASVTTPTENFDISLKARDNWNVKSLTIYDFDEGYLRLYRGDLTVAEFDIVADAPAPAGAISFGSGTFTEVAANDGSTISTIVVTLANDTFTGVDASNYAGTKALVTNVPAGLTAVVTKDSATQVTVTLTGNATNHELGNSIVNLEVAFQDTAFTTVLAANITGSTKSDIAVDFADAAAAGGFPHSQDFTSAFAVYEQTTYGDSPFLQFDMDLYDEGLFINQPDAYELLVEDITAQPSFVTETSATSLFQVDVPTEISIDFDVFAFAHTIGEFIDFFVVVDEIGPGFPGAGIEVQGGSISVTGDGSYTATISSNDIFIGGGITQIGVIKLRADSPTADEFTTVAIDNIVISIL